MNNYVGGNGNNTFLPGWTQSDWPRSVWRVYRKMDEMLDPGPSMTWVFLDEREDSMNDGFWVTEMTGWPSPATTQIVDYPASYHNNAAGFSFADGHAEIKRWLDSRTMPPVKKVTVTTVNQAGNPDVVWLWQHTTSKR
jgi:prepilin-type processing-associated H-X9-DG protein